MSIALSGAGWHCWRNAAHRGRKATRLIQALLHCSFERAAELAGEGTASMPTDDDFAMQMRVALGAAPASRLRPARLELPSEFKSLDTDSRFADPFWDYLRQRGYTVKQINWMARAYDLRYALRGPYRYRVIIPVYDPWGRLVSWTGRTILRDEELRYKTLPVESRFEDETVALAAPGSTLLGMQVLTAVEKPRVLVICEGPFDALRVSALGHDLGVYGTCLFGLNVSDDQAAALMRLEHFPRVVMCLDADAQMRALRLADRFLPVRVRLVTLPDGVKDPGDLQADDGAAFVRNLVGL